MAMMVIALVIFLFLHQRRMFDHQMTLIALAEQKQKELLDASIQGEEEERIRISTELHDDVGATLATVKLILNQAIKSGDNDLLYETEDLVNNTFNKIREISQKLNPSNLVKLGLEATIQSLVDVINKSNELRIDFIPSQMNLRLADNVELGLYRITQELIHNLMKHANTTYIVIETYSSGGKYNLVVKHNGVGLTNETFQLNLYKDRSLGLKNIMNRVNTINGSINFSDNNLDLPYHINIIVSLK